MAAATLGVMAASSEHWPFSLSFRLLETKRVKFRVSSTFTRAPTNIPNWWIESSRWHYQLRGLPHDLANCPHSNLTGTSQCHQERREEIIRKTGVWDFQLYPSVYRNEAV